MNAAQTTRECEPGVTLGHYQVLGKIGAGGMGEVFRAHDQHLDREVAIKALPHGALADESARKRFRREALTLSKINHPNIATIHDFDTHQGIDFLVMEYIPGITLNVMAAPLPEREIIALAIQLAEGLSAAHEHGIIHRDLKPGNLRVTDDGRLKILDFGLAKLRLPIPPSAPTATLSESQTIAGTLPFMAPEQLLGGEIDARTDIHAAGAVLYWLATGHQPFEWADGSSLIAAILHLQPRSPFDFNPALSHGLAQVIGKCLEKQAESRYQSAKELAVDLRRLARAETSRHLAQDAPAVSRTGWIDKQKKVLAIASVMVILMLLVAIFLARIIKPAETARVLPSIAVLPFVDLSAERNQQYFSDGLAEELLNSLAKLNGLRVAARTSAFQFKGKNDDLRNIGQKLHVAAILEGSVQKAGNRVRVTVRLTKVDAGLTLWSESYDRDFKDIFAVEDDIAAAVTSALQIKLLGQTLLTAPSRTTNPEAYQAFLQARSCDRTFDSQSQQKAFEYVNRAIQFDPNYAPAYALRGVMTAESGLMASMTLSTAMENSRRDAEKAIALDPNLAAGYLALSENQALAQWDWQGAERSVRKARELAPGDADVLEQSGYLAMSQGRLEEAAGLMNQGLSLDPLAPSKHLLLAQVLRDLGRYEAALGALQKAVELSPQQVWTHETRGEVYLAQHLLSEALQEMENEPPGPWRDFGEALAYHALGRRQDADSALARLITQHQNDAAFQIAQVYAYRDESDKCFHWLERARRQHDGGLGHLKADWLLKKLRTDPRFVRLLRESNLPV